MSATLPPRNVPLRARMVREALSGLHMDDRITIEEHHAIGRLLNVASDDMLARSGADGAMSVWPFLGLTPLRYRVILADPPWRFRTWGEHNQHKSASKHYPLMRTEDIAALPVNQLAAPDCLLMMWAVQPMIPQALDLMKAWGFTYKTMGAWAKQSSTGEKWAFGTGYLLRCAAEFFIVGTIGKPAPLARNIRNLIVAPTREHSRKPDEMHENLERMFPRDPRCELFARQQRAGWDVWGNQTDRFATPPP